MTVYSRRGSVFKIFDRELLASTRSFPCCCPDFRPEIPDFCLAFYSRVPISSKWRCFLKSWISIVLICSFLRLQLVCCCGTVGLCDTQAEVSALHEVGHQGTSRCCSGWRKSSEPNFEVRKDVVKTKKCRCQHARKDSSGPDLISQQQSNRRTCAELNGPRNEESHHHLLWIVHGNSLPSEKSSLKSLSDVNSRPLPSIVYPRVCDRRDWLNRFASPPRVDILSLLGQRRI
jgi:hypothetical protein